MDIQAACISTPFGPPGSRGFESYLPKSHRRQLPRSGLPTLQSAKPSKRDGSRVLSWLLLRDLLNEVVSSLVYVLA